MSATPASASDEELLRLTRDSTAADERAFAELWRRHADAGRRVARAVAPSADPDDLVSEAYLRILSALRGGRGPVDSFRPYLYAVIRSIAIGDTRSASEITIDDFDEREENAIDEDQALNLFEHSAVVRAFRSLPEDSRTVLWYTEVEGLSPQEVAPLLGVSSNSAAARSYRARAALRKAWVRAHVSEIERPAECRRTIEHLHQSAVTDADELADARARKHLAGCASCQAAQRELTEAHGRLAIILLGLILGPAAARAFLDERRGSGSGDASLAGRASSLPHTAVLAGAAGLVAVAAVATALLLGGPRAEPATEWEPPGPVTLPEQPEVPTTEEPTTAPEATETGAPAPTGQSGSDDDSGGTPDDEEEPEEPDPTPPPDPGTPVIDFDPATGRVVLTGTGGVPGATIEAWGTVTSPVTGTTSAPILLASATIPVSGDWSSPALGGITPVDVTVWVVQRGSNGVASGEVEVIAGAFFGIEVDSAAATMSGSTAGWTLLGWPGASWEIREPGTTTVVASGTLDANGEVAAAVDLSGYPAATTVDFEFGYVVDGSILLATDLLSATTP